VVVADATPVGRWRSCSVCSSPQHRMNSRVRAAPLGAELRYTLSAVRNFCRIYYEPFTKGGVDRRVWRVQTLRT
jgi:hypothetical protein